MTGIKHQKGSMMIEVVAVVALLALLTPLLFRQIQRRTNEVDNVRVATAMRGAKDALQRAIEDNIANLEAHSFHDQGNDRCILIPTNANRNDWGNKRIVDYAPTLTLPNVNTYVCRHQVDGKEDKPIYFGVVVWLEDTFFFLTAADIATMIGAEGGVCAGTDHAVGVREGWDVDRAVFGGFECDAGSSQVVAITSLVGSSGFGASIDSVVFGDFITDTGTIQGTRGYFGADDAGNGGWVHIDNGLTVGDTNCITNAWDPTLDENPAGCTPTFEVIPDDPNTADADGQVVIYQGQLYFDQATADQYQTPNVMGHAQTPIPQGPGAANVLTDATTADPLVGTNVQYVIDPAGESVMTDIRLRNRGNALLSDLLPNYVLKGIRTCTNGVDDSGNAGRVDNVWNFICPENHRKVVVLGDFDRNANGDIIAWVNGNDLQCNNNRDYRVYQYCVFNP